MLAWTGAAAALIIALLLGYSAWFTADINAAKPPLGAFHRIDGTDLHVVTRGDPADPAIVFVHGASGNARDPLLAFDDRLSGDHYLVAIDRPGHGHSTRGADPDIADPERQADLIAGAIADLGLDRPLVVAHSLAGTVGLNLALGHADKISGLVLLAPVSHPWPGGVNWYHHLFATPVLGPLAARLIGAPVGNLILATGVGQVFAPNPPAADYIDRAGARLALRPGTLVANGRDLVDLHSYVAEDAPRYPDIDLPVTVVSGDADDIVWTSIHTEGLRQAIPGAKAVVLPGVGHMPHHVAPDIVEAEIRRHTGVVSGRTAQE